LAANVGATKGLFDPPRTCLEDFQELPWCEAMRHEGHLIRCLRWGIFGKNSLEKDGKKHGKTMGKNMGNAAKEKKT